MKLWLLDADVIIDLIRLEIFDKLAALHEISAASTVIDEVKFYVKHGVKVPIPFRGKYVDTGTVREVSAEPEELAEALNRVPEDQRSVIHGGELESMAVLVRRDDLVFCSCDAATIRTLPFLDLSERGISAERLLKTSGLTQSSFEDRHTEAYFKSNLDIGKKNKLDRLLSTNPS